MALKSGNQAKEIDVDEVLGDIEKLVDRLRVIYEQYFLGIQRTAPTHLHSDAERRIRDVTHLQLRNTGQRYRLATLTQKFGSYNSYWKRTIRDIEAGRYVRDLSRIQRQSARSGEEIPEEVLAAMPKRMREMIERDRKAAEANAKRRGGKDGPLADTTTPPHDASGATSAAAAPKPRSNTHQLDESLLGNDFDIDEMFKGMETKTEQPALPRTRTGPRRRPTSVSDLDKPRTRTGETKRPKPAVTMPSPPPTHASAPMYLTDDEELDNIANAITGGKSAGSRRGTNAPMPPPPPQSPPPSARLARQGTSLPPPAPATRAPAAPSARPISPPAPTAAPPPGMSEAETRALYAKYVKAREVVRDGSETMSYDRLVRHLRQQAPKIMEAHKSSGVEFGVVIKDNKIVIKAKPKP